jgi:PEP-CTERM motif
VNCVHILSSIIWASILASQHVFASPVTTESEVILSTRDCSSLALTDDCTVIARSIFLRPRAANADQSQAVSGDFGLVSSQIQRLDDGASLRMTVNMESAMQSRNGATAQAIQRFTWLGENNSALPFLTSLSYRKQAQEQNDADSEISGTGVIGLTFALVDLSLFDESLFLGAPFLRNFGCRDEGVLAFNFLNAYGNNAESNFNLPAVGCNAGSVQLTTGTHYGVLSSVYSIGNRGAAGSGLYEIKFAGNAADLGALTPSTAPVPEPQALAFLGLGAVVLFARRKSSKYTNNISN